MPKFSVVIPAYNVGKYIDKCLNSVFACNEDLEIIVVNDGSTDNTPEILEKYAERIKVINQKNQGLSMARNNGIKAVTGEYFILLDGDDYIESDLFKKLNESVKNDPDIVRFQIRDVFEDRTVDYVEKSFNAYKGPEAFKEIIDFHYVEPAVCYLYRTEYFKENGFEYTPGVYHEDYGLTPLVVVKAKCVNCLDYIGYNYVQNQSSIMHSNDYEKVKKKAWDILKLYNENIDKSDDPTYKYFYANGIIGKARFLNDEDLAVYEKEAKKRKYYDYLYEDSLKRKIKKQIARWSLKQYIRLFLNNE